jgi:cytosine/uracil/thiamine/allantoin permease
MDAPLDPPEPRWPAVIAVLAVGGIYLALPNSLAVGPRWLQPAIVLVLLVPTIITHHRRNHALNQLLGHALAGVITLFMVWSLVLLVLAVPTHKELPVIMLRSAAALWVTNVIVFALWYWRLDGGGPHGRELQIGHRKGAFLFPQMTLEDKGQNDGPAWSPNFVDYLFLAFNTSTAFSPTDTPVLSRWAKVLTMLQCTISLTVVIVLAARAVNIL